MPQCDTLLFSDYIALQDTSRTLLSDGAIAIENGRIRDVGKREELQKTWQAKDCRALGNTLILPGLINAHTHVAMTFLRGLADDMPLMQWLERIFSREAHLTREIVHCFSLLGFAEMLSTGTSACLDMYLFEEEIFSAAEQAGIRLCAGEGVFGFPSCSSQSWHEALEKTEDFAKKYARSDRLSTIVSPHSVYTTDDTILSACIEFADKTSLPLHIHLSESASETEKSLELHHLRPIPYLTSLGFFEQSATLAHVVDVNEEDLSLLAQAKKSVCVHNPISNLKLGSGISPVPKMLKKEISVALGSDGPASNNQLNMFSEMHLAAVLHKGVHKKPEILPAQTVLDLATRSGAHALHNPLIGSLEIGKKADLTVLDLSSPNMQPLENPISQAVYAATGHEVCLTMVEGEIVFDHGKFSKFDYPSLLKEIKRLHADIRKRGY